MKTPVAKTSTLVNKLRVGASVALFSPDAWASQLDQADPLAQEFLQHMRQEWFPANPPDALCRDMLFYTRHYILSKPSGGPHLWAHILRVTGMALALAPEAKIEPAHAFMMGIFHDIGKLDEGQLDHEEIGAQFAQQQLEKHYPKSVIDQIVTAILKENDDRYGALLHDADKLDKIGATGIVRRLSVSSAPHYIIIALRKLRDDLRTFPEMNYPTSTRLASNKKNFTRDFLLMVE